MRNIIIVSTVGLIYDGITSVITSYLKAMNKEDLKIYVVSTIRSELDIEKKIEELGCEIVYLPSRRTRTINYFFSLLSFIRKNKIQVIHAHGNSATLTIEMLAGFMGGCKKRIAHSHNTKCNQVKVDKMLRPVFNVLYTDALACGVEAGNWLFKNKNFTVLKNGRDINDYLFSQKKRLEMRTKYNLKENICIGHVGGFYAQKNHVFVIEVFRKILEIEPKAKLFLIGDGPLREEIEFKVSDIKNHVYFIGIVNNVTDYLQAMDGMLLPSIFEGLPLVAIEWQINGLPCLISDSITKDCIFTNTVKCESITESPIKWAKELLEMIKKSDRRKNSEKSQKSVRIRGFDIQDNVKLLRDLYLS